jgi:hypothetical protein
MMADPETSQEQDVQYDFVPGNFLNSLFGTAKAVLLSPRRFYQRMKTDGGLRNPALFLVCCVLIHTLFVGVSVRDQTVVVRNMTYGMAMPFVTAGILFLFITRVFKASGTYEAAFRVNAYAAAVNLVTWVPMVGLFLEFYRLYLIAWGLSYAFSIRISRSALAIVMTMITYIVLGHVVFNLLGGQQPAVAP